MVLSKDMKIAICFGLIMGALISICNMCFAAEDVTFNTLEGLTIQQNTGYVVTGTANLGYIEIQPGYVYTFKNNLSSNFRIIGFSNKVLEYHDYVDDYSEVGPQQTFSFTYSDYKYAYFNINNTSSVTLTREPLQGMTNFVDNLAYDLSYANLSGVLFFVVPIMAIGILFALGFYLLKRLLNKIKRAKGGA